MWAISPSKLCDRHLLGEHVELHMIVWSLNMGTSMEGFYANKLVDTDRIVPRHDELVEEMVKRGFKHASPLPAFENPHRGEVVGDPLERCWKCRDR